MSLLPLVTFEPIERAQLNTRLLLWDHAMGPCERPTRGWAHGLAHNGELVAVAATDTLVAPQVAGLDRSRALELSRMCAARPDLCRVTLRLWREFVFRPLAESHGYEWALSYQDERLHTGDLYRFDGWMPLVRTRSGTDTRSGRRGRNKTTWGWSPYPELMAARRAELKAAAEPKPVDCATCDGLGRRFHRGWGRCARFGGAKPCDNPGMGIPA